jgi:hypothetical protein
MTSDVADFVIRGRKVRIDKNGLVSLNDLHKASGYSTNKTPTQWRRLDITKRLTLALLEKTKTARLSSGKISTSSIIYALEGHAGDTFAHPVLALSYAEFLNSSLALEVREVFLRYKAADAKLADDILQRATPEANEWAGARAIGRVTRHVFTGILKSHGVLGRGYPDCTNAIYLALFDAKASDLRAKKQLKKHIPLRDKMETKELVFVSAAEHLAGERIEETRTNGNEQCAIASMKSASFIRQAIEGDRADRKRDAR